MNNVNKDSKGPKRSSEVRMFSGTIIDDLVKTVQTAEANLETEYRMREELQGVPAFMMNRYETFRTSESVLFGVA